MEIDMWKKTERDKFMIHLKDLESKQSDALSEEFKRRERQRELLVRRKNDEIAKLEAKLQDSIRLLDEREKRIAADEERIQRERKAMKVSKSISSLSIIIICPLQSEFDAKLAEIKDASHRFEADHAYQLTTERQRSQDLRDQLRRLTEEKTAAETRTRKIEAEFALYKDKQHSTPPVRTRPTTPIHL